MFRCAQLSSRDTPENWFSFVNACRHELCVVLDSGTRPARNGPTVLPRSSDGHVGALPQPAFGLHPPLFPLSSISEISERFRALPDDSVNGDVMEGASRGRRKSKEGRILEWRTEGRERERGRKEETGRPANIKAPNERTTD